jgi:hypothetical protein
MAGGHRHETGIDRRRRHPMEACANGKDLGKVAQTAATVARDTVYVVVGLGVLAVQRAQVQRVAVTEKLSQTKLGQANVPGNFGRDINVQEKLDEAVKLATRQMQQIDGLVEKAVQFVETTIEPLEAQLPDPAQNISKKAREQARSVRTQIRVRVIPAA